jgi:hypothetical protein
MRARLRWGYLLRSPIPSGIFFRRSLKLAAFAIEAAWLNFTFLSFVAPPAHAGAVCC